jgi:hypothetical protein
MEIEVFTIDIIQDVLQAPAAVGSYRGEEISKYIEKVIKNIQPGKILVLDLVKALPLHYVFCQFAFGPLLKSIQQEFILPIVFKMHEHHKQCFFRGIVKYLDKDLPRIEAEKEFIDSGMFTILLFDGDHELKFISNLTPIEEDLLNLINSNSSMTQRDIIEAKEDIQPSDIIDSLRSLNRKGFIINLKDNSEIFYSISKIVIN